jgi:hypothetical protein
MVLQLLGLLLLLSVLMLEALERLPLHPKK